MNDEQTPPHVPMTEEQKGNTWEYCYGQDGQAVVLPPPQPMEPDHEHHQ